VKNVINFWVPWNAGNFLTAQYLLALKKDFMA
jgi:hypothetical protein